MKSLFEKNVLITGGSTGIGFATAKVLVAQGANVWITGRKADALERAKNAINDDKLQVLVSDTASLVGIQELAQYFVNHNIKIDVLFLNAGIASFNSIALATEEEFDSQFAINVKGAFFTLQKFIPQLNESASVIINASTNATAAALGSAVYSATKAAIIKIAQVAANELAPQKIRVNVVSPGPTLTPGLEGVVPHEALDYLAGKTAQQRLGTGEEIAKVVAFLASSESSFITGTEIIADGGLVNYTLR